MQVTKNKKTGLFNLEGLTEGKMLCLQRILNYMAPRDTEICRDLSICVTKGVNFHIAFGTEEKP